MMLQPDAAQLLGKRQQKLVPVERTAAEQRHRLIDQRGVRGDMFWPRLEKPRLVGKGVERHAIAQRPLSVMRAREHRRIDQSLVIGDAEVIAIAAHLQPVERGNADPFGRQDHARADRDGAGGVASGVERNLLELEIEHGGGDDDAAFCRAGR